MTFQDTHYDHAKATEGQTGRQSPEQSDLEEQDVQ